MTYTTVTLQVPHFGTFLVQKLFNLKKTWNVAFRVMFKLPRETHCYFVEAISGKPHLKTVLIKRFLNFIDQIRNSKKVALKSVLELVIKDARSVTGKNMRNILLLTDKVKVNEITPEDISKIKYRVVPEEETWRVGFLRELIEVKHGDLQVFKFTADEVQDMLYIVCIT